MSREPAPSDIELHELADDRLHPARREAARARLARDAQAAEQVAFYRSLNAALHRLYDPLLDEPDPVVLPLRRWRLLPRLGRAAAVALLVLAGAGAGWLARDRLGADPDPAVADGGLARMAASAHEAYAVEVRHPVEVSVDQEAHLVQWLSKRLGAEVRAPDLSAHGFRLMGGRLLPAGTGLAGQFMYENEAGLRATLFLVSGGGREESAFRFVREDDLSVFYWRDGRFGYALSAPLPRPAMLALCADIYAQLEAAEPSG